MICIEMTLGFIEVVDFKGNMGCVALRKISATVRAGIDLVWTFFEGFKKVNLCTSFPEPTIPL